MKPTGTTKPNSTTSDRATRVALIAWVIIVLAFGISTIIITLRR